MFRLSDLFILLAVVVSFVVLVSGQVGRTETGLVSRCRVGASF